MTCKRFQVLDQEPQQDVLSEITIWHFQNVIHLKDNEFPVSQLFQWRLLLWVSRCSNHASLFAVTFLQGSYRMDSNGCTSTILFFQRTQHHKIAMK